MYHSTEQNVSLTADSRSDAQNVCHILRKPKVYNRVYKSLSLDLILNHINKVHVLTTYLYRIYFHIIFPSMPSSTRLPLMPRFSVSNVERTYLRNMCYTCRPSRSP